MAEDSKKQTKRNNKIMFSVAGLIFTCSLISFNIGNCKSSNWFEDNLHGQSSASVGSLAILPCNFSLAYYPEYTVQWWKVRKTLYGGYMARLKFAFIYNATAKATKESKRYSPLIGRHVEYSFELYTGFEFTNHTEFEAANNETEFEYTNNTEFEYTNHVTNHTGLENMKYTGFTTLTIHEVNYCDNGIYECSVTTKLGQDRWYYKLSVEQSDFTMFYFGFTYNNAQETYDNNSVITIGASTTQPIIVNCILDRTNLNPTTWTRYGEIDLQEGEIVQALEMSYNSTFCDYYLSLPLVITPTVHHIGLIQYTCRFTNRDGNYKESFITIQFPPQPTWFPSSAQSTRIVSLHFSLGLFLSIVML